MDQIFENQQRMKSVMIEKMKEEIESLQKALQEATLNFRAAEAHKNSIERRIDDLQWRLMDIKGSSQIELDQRPEMPRD
jgi:chromosome segregation ATPase